MSHWLDLESKKGKKGMWLFIPRGWDVIRSDLIFSDRRFRSSNRPFTHRSHSSCQWSQMDRCKCACQGGLCMTPGSDTGLIYTDCHLKTSRESFSKHSHVMASFCKVLLIKKSSWGEKEKHLYIKACLENNQQWLLPLTRSITWKVRSLRVREKVITTKPALQHFYLCCLCWEKSFIKTFLPIYPTQNAI